jgi:uncharacterized protein DUF4232
MTPTMRSAPRLIAAGAMTLAVMLVAACGATHSPPAATPTAGTAGSATAGASDSATPTASVRATAPGGSPAAPAVAACGNSTLRPSLAPMGAAAGTTYYALRLTNVSASSCTLYGYPGVSFLSGIAGRQIGSAALRNPVYPATTVVLAVNGTANATLGVAEAVNYPASRCRPTAAHALRIYPPGQTVPLYITQTFAACSADVTVLTVSTMRAGAGGQG